MKAVEHDEGWELKSPATGKTLSVIKARDLWIRILTARIETGEPYILYIDRVNELRPETYKRLGLEVKTSNLCIEIMLATGKDQHKVERTAVCCLSSLNLEYFDEWQHEPKMIEDAMRFIDNVLEDFIQNAPESMKNAKYSAMRERSIGLGVMGFHSLLQSKGVPLESVMAKSWNNKIFRHIKQSADKASYDIALDKGPCLDAAEVGLMERFTHKIAIAPTASISIIAGNSSPGIEPYSANTFTQKTLTGSFSVRNKHLKTLLTTLGKDTDEVWSSIMNHEGSVQHFDWLTDDQKDVFKTAFEIDQRWIIELAADRTPNICQSQSLNIFIPADIHKRDLHMLHFTAWRKGIKSLYYCRSKSLQRADKISLGGEQAAPVQLSFKLEPIATYSQVVKEEDKYDECLACQ